MSTIINKEAALTNLEIYYKTLLSLTEKESLRDQIPKLDVKFQATLRDIKAHFILFSSAEQQKIAEINAQYHQTITPWQKKQQPSHENQVAKFDTESKLTKLKIQHELLLNCIKKESLQNDIAVANNNFQTIFREIKAHFTYFSSTEQQKIAEINTQYHQTIALWKKEPARSKRENLETSDISALLPLFSKIVEEDGDTEGLYRLSGVKTSIQSHLDGLKQGSVIEEIQKSQQLIFSSHFMKHIHNITGLIKAMFRDMKTPLLKTIQNELIAIDPNIASIADYQAVINKLLPENKRLLLQLLKHLHKISQSSAINQMPASNLATCFAPNLFAQNENLIIMGQEAGPQNICLAFLIEHATELV